MPPPSASGSARAARKPLPPLEPETLSAFAVRYVERFQTSRARLIRLLRQKLRQRGWADGHAEPDLEAIADRMVALGYVNDAAFAEARTRGLARRGIGAGRVRTSLAAYGIDRETSSTALEGHDARAAAIDFARRKRLGPFGPPVSDPKVRHRQLGAMARAGHPSRLARAILDARTEDELPQEE